MTRTQGTVRAAELAERIVDEISHAGQDWAAIELHAHGLAELAASLRDCISAQRLAKER